MVKNKETGEYQKMFKQVEEIVQKMSHTDMDLDHMIDNVEKGYDLIKKMRIRLDQAKQKIEKIHLENQVTENS